MPTPFEIIKNNAEKAKRESMAAEAERNSLEREEERIRERIEEATGKRLTTVEEIQKEKEALTEQVMEKMKQMAQTLDEASYFSEGDRNFLIEKGVL